MICLVCGKDGCSPFPVKDLEYLECPECGSITLSVGSRLVPEDQQKRYELHENTLEQEGYRLYLEKFLTQALSAYRTVHKSEPSSVLDYGSGPEPCLVQLMNEKGLNAVGWDPFFNPHSLDEGNADDSFDLVTCLEVAEHFESPEQSFRHLASLVKKDGVVVIGTNLIPDSSRQPFATWWYRFDPTHVTFYTLDGLKECAGKAGLGYLESVSEKVFAFKKLQ